MLDYLEKTSDMEGAEQAFAFFRRVDPFRIRLPIACLSFLLFMLIIATFSLLKRRQPLEDLLGIDSKLQLEEQGGLQNGHDVVWDLSDYELLRYFKIAATPDLNRLLLCFLHETRPDTLATDFAILDPSLGDLPFFFIYYTAL